MFCRQSLIVFFALVLCLPVQAAAKKKVVFIRYRIAPTYFATVVKGFKEVMTERGYEAGKNISYVDVLTSTADKKSVPEVLAAIQEYQGSADMFITCGWVSMYAREKLEAGNVPQLFVPVLRSVALKMLPSVTAEPETNLSGIYLMYPPEKILRLAHLILPDMQHYAYVFDSRIPADMVFKSAYEELAPNDRHGIEIVYIDLAQGVGNVLRELKEKHVEVYGGIVGAFKQRKELAVSRLPVITSFTLDIEREEIGKYVRESNVVAGLFNSFAYGGRQAAEMTADIFDGKRTIAETIPRPSRQTAFVNLAAAKRLGLSVPFAALEAVDVVVK